VSSKENIMTPTQTFPPQDNQIGDNKSTSYGSLMVFILVVALSITTSMGRHQNNSSKNSAPASMEHVQQSAKSNLGTAENPVALDEVVYSVQRY
jgi:hypothetical protein